MITLVYPLIEPSVTLRFVVEAFFYIAFLGIIMAAAARPGQFVLSCSLGSLLLISRAASYAFEGAALLEFSAVMGALFYAHTIYVLTVYIFMERRRVDADLIFGAISVYLMLGTMWAFIYYGIKLFQPDAFVGLEEFGPSNEDAFATFVYFSFTTLTTLGYGDISPAGERVAVIAYFEAVTGQVYLTVLVARLVGMHLAQRSRGQ